MATMSGLTVRQALAGALQAAQQTLDATMADVDDALANAPAPGNANPIGSCYVHVHVAEDGVLNGLLLGKQPRFATDLAGRTGADQPMPMPGMVEGDIGKWYKTSKIDLAAAREYAQAINADALSFISEADDATLSKLIDMSFAGAGQMPLAAVFAVFVIGHINNLCGEISAIKGALGRQGYPF